MARRRHPRTAPLVRFFLRLPWRLMLVLCAVAAALTFAGLIYLPWAAWLNVWPLRAWQPTRTPPLPFAAFGAAVWLALGVVGAFQSWQHQRIRQQLVRRATNLAALQTLSWQEFELLVGQLYRHQGYYVTETGLGGADGGVDLVAEKWGSGEKIVVQCKHYKSTSVGVPIVRELYGLMVHHQATGAAVVCCGHFTQAAYAFAQGKPLVLVGVDKLLIALQKTRK